MLLLITGTKDFTANAICEKLGSKVFRFNYDIFNEYSLEYTIEGWKISNPTGHYISSDNIKSCFWWKAFHYTLEHQDPLIVEEVKYIFRELYAWCKIRNIVKGNPPNFHQNLGKMNILEIASRYFKVPKTLASFRCEGVNKFESIPVVAKSFSSTLTAKNASLLTVEVDKSKLHPDFPWHLQEKIDSDFDFTVFICGDSLFSYKRSRKNLKGLDWRAEQNFSNKENDWKKAELKANEKKNIFSFCKKINVDWGRLDFMTVDSDLVFLEFNANGQWLFLDYFNDEAILENVVNFLLPTKSNV